MTSQKESRNNLIRVMGVAVFLMVSCGKDQPGVSPNSSLIASPSSSNGTSADHAEVSSPASDSVDALLGNAFRLALDKDLLLPGPSNASDGKLAFVDGKSVPSAEANEYPQGWAHACVLTVVYSPEADEYFQQKHQYPDYVLPKGVTLELVRERGFDVTNGITSVALAVRPEGDQAVDLAHSLILRRADGSLESGPNFTVLLGVQISGKELGLSDIQKCFADGSVGPLVKLR